MDRQALFVYDDGELKYKFNDHHPFNQKRLVLTADLLRKTGALPAEALLKPRMASDEELRWIHAPAYIDAVKRLSVPSPDHQALQDADRFGLSTEDTPFFPGMHEATAMIAGGSLTAAEAVMTGRSRHALHLGGGLHHALESKGSGFCVYNDASIAIAYIRRRFDAKVLYIDTDVHHGDGVQWSFYTEPNVVTYSIHETGKYLFPGTGGVAERGDGDGFGACINMPLEPYTEDDSWLDCFEDVLRGVIARVRPDVIVSQHGCDAHAYDPLAHVHCSMEIYRRMPQLIRDLADEWCGGRWIALGGGGYDIWRVVPRAWSLLWLVMSGHPLPDRLQSEPALLLPQDWLAQWQPQCGEPLPATWLDPVDDWEPMPRRSEIMAKNRQTKEVAMLYL